MGLELGLELELGSGNLGGAWVGLELGLGLEPGVELGWELEVGSLPSFGGRIALAPPWWVCAWRVRLP